MSKSEEVPTVGFGWDGGGDGPIGLTEAQWNVVRLIAKERDHQDALVRRGKFSWNCSFDGAPYSEKLAVLMEEVGEVAREVVEHIITRDKYAADPALKTMPPHREEYFRGRIKGELIQIAAVCVAWVEHLSGAESTVQAELEAKCHKFVIVHPSDRLLVVNPVSHTECWAEGSGPVLFDSQSAAWEHVDERAAQWPESDWPQARVARYTLGLPEVHPKWTPVERRAQAREDDEGCTHHTSPLTGFVPNPAGLSKGGSR